MNEYIKADYRYDGEPNGHVFATKTVGPSGLVGIGASETFDGEYRSVVLHFSPERAAELATAILGAAVQAKLDVLG